MQTQAQSQKSNLHFIPYYTVSSLPLSASLYSLCVHMYIQMQMCVVNVFACQSVYSVQIVCIHVAYMCAYVCVHSHVCVCVCGVQLCIHPCGCMGKPKVDIRMSSSIASVPIYIVVSILIQDLSLCLGLIVSARVAASVL